MISSDVAQRLIKFLIVGGLSTVVNYGVFYGLYESQLVGYLPASAIGFITGLVLGYFLNKAWAFDAQDASHGLALGYVLTYAINLGASQLILFVLVEKWALSPALANVPALAYTTVANFVGLHFFVFKRSTHS